MVDDVQMLSQEVLLDSSISDGNKGSNWDDVSSGGHTAVRCGRKDAFDGEGPYPHSYFIMDDDSITRQFKSCE